MRGELIGVWASAWTDIWEPLAAREDAPGDLFVELFRELTQSFKTPLSVEQLADAIDNPEQSRSAFQFTDVVQFRSEAAIVRFFEDAYVVLEDFGIPSMNHAYFEYLNNFISKYSLRYDLQPPCILTPTLTGLFSSLVRDLKSYTDQDPHLRNLMSDFDHAVRDLRGGLSDHRIKTCIQKQVNLIEAIGRASPGITQTTLGRICDQITDWPHDKVKDAMKSLYSFTCDYPGIRHGGTPANANQTISVRDLVAISILLFGFTPYLCGQLDPNAVYQGD